MTNKEGLITFNKAGYVPIDVKFFSNNNDFGVILMWKRPGDNDFSVIPTTKYGYIPEASFTYSSTMVHYYRYVNINGNLPVFFATSVMSPEYRIDPLLPAGLMLQASGMISGSADVESEATTYTVTAESGSLVLTTVISIEVTYVAPPLNVLIKNKAGEEVSSVTIVQFEAMDYLQLSAENRPTDWRTEPALPDGLTIDRRSMRIAGTPSVSMLQTAFTISASNNGGITSKTLFISITGCQYGKWFFSNFRVGNGGLVVTKDNTTVYSNSAVTIGLYGVKLCIPNGDYDYVFTCNQNSGKTGCVFSILREDEMTFVGITTRAGSTAKGVLSTVITSKPTLTTPTTTFTLAAREPISLSFESTGIHKPIYSSPALPSSFTLNTASNVLSGSFNTKGSYVYTIISENEFGQAKVTLTFNVGTCPENKNLISLSRSYGRSGETMMIKTASGDVIVNEVFTNEAYSRTICMANGDYSVDMTTTATAGGWTVGQELLIKDSWEDLLSSSTMDEGKKTQTDYFTINYAIMDQLPIKYLKGTAAKGWNGVDFNDKSWKEAVSGSFGNFTTTAVYFRREFTVDNRNKYPIFAFDLEIMDGVVAYIDGKEVARRNMPVGEISASTEAVARYDSLIWRRTSVATSSLQNGKNVLAVELHRFTKASDSIIHFDLYGSLLSGTCMQRTDRGAASDSQHTPNARYVPANAFDSDAQSVWRDSNLPVFLQFTYNYDRFEYINKVIIRAGQKYNKGHPKKFDILGIVDQNKGDILASVDDRNLFTAAYSNTEIYLSNTKTYNAYRLQINQTNDESNTANVGEMILYSCNIVYCAKEKGWPSIMTGDMTYGACPRNMFGETTRSCSISMFDPQWSAVDTSSCLSTKPSSNAAFIDFKYMVSNCTMENYNRYVNSRFIDNIRNILLAKKENIIIFLKRDCSDSETKNVCMNVRVGMDLRIADYVFEKMGEMQEQMSYLMYEGAPQGFPKGMYFVMAINPILRKPTSKTAIAVIVVLVLIIMIVTSVILYNFKGSKMSKRVRGGSVQRRGTLDLHEKIERNKKEKKGLMSGDIPDSE